MTQVEMLQKVLEAAVKVEDGMVESYEASGKSRIASEHFHRSGGIEYALNLMNDPCYLKRQAEILGLLPRPARKAAAYQPLIEARRQNGIG